MCLMGMIHVFYQDPTWIRALIRSTNQTTNLIITVRSTYFNFDQSWSDPVDFPIFCIFKYKKNPERIPKNSEFFLENLEK